MASKKANWRQQHAAFIANVRAAKMAQDAEKAGKPIPRAVMEVLNAPSVSAADMVQCPHCGRRFNEHAAERHIAFCEQQHARVTNQRGPPPARGAPFGGPISGRPLPGPTAGGSRPVPTGMGPPPGSSKVEAGSRMQARTGYKPPPPAPAKVPLRTSPGTGSGQRGFASSQPTGRAAGSGGRMAPLPKIQQSGSAGNLKGYSGGNYDDDDDDDLDYPPPGARGFSSGLANKMNGIGPSGSGAGRGQFPVPGQGPAISAGRHPPPSSNGMQMRMTTGGMGQGGPPPGRSAGAPAPRPTGGVRGAVPSAPSGNQLLQQVSARFCHECGTSFPSPTVKFCVECGAKRIYIS